VKPFCINQGGIRLAIAPRPRGEDWFENDMGLLRLAGVNVLVSVLPQDEAAELPLTSEG